MRDNWLSLDPSDAPQYSPKVANTDANRPPSSIESGRTFTRIYPQQGAGPGDSEGAKKCKVRAALINEFNSLVVKFDSDSDKQTKYVKSLDGRFSWNSWGMNSDRKNISELGIKLEDTTAKLKELQKQIFPETLVAPDATPKHPQTPQQTSSSPNRAFPLPGNPAASAAPADTSRIPGIPGQTLGTAPTNSPSSAVVNPKATRSPSPAASLIPRPVATRSAPNSPSMSRSGAKNASAQSSSSNPSSPKIPTNPKPPVKNRGRLLESPDPKTSQQIVASIKEVASTVTPITTPTVSATAEEPGFDTFQKASAEKQKALLNDLLHHFDTMFVNPFEKSTKSLEKDYGILSSKLESLRRADDKIHRDKLLSEINELLTQLLRPGVLKAPIKKEIENILAGKNPKAL